MDPRPGRPGAVPHLPPRPEHAALRSHSPELATHRGRSSPREKNAGLLVSSTTQYQRNLWKLFHCYSGTLDANACTFGKRHKSCLNCGIDSSQVFHVPLTSLLQVPSEGQRCHFDRPYTFLSLGDFAAKPRMCALSSGRGGCNGAEVWVAASHDVSPGP